MNATRNRGRHRRGASARARRVRGLLAAGAALLIAAASTAGSTTASYVDAEHSGGAFTAATLGAITPTIAPNVTSAGASWSASPVGSSPSYSLSRATDSSGTGATTSYVGSGTSTTDGVATASSSQSAYVRTVSVGAAHTCAIADGKVFCWGLNTSGQVGNGTTTSAVSVPTVVPLASNDVTAVSAGASHTCAIVADAAYCWGDNTYGEVGNGTSATSFSSPQAVAGLSGMTVTAISAGNGFSCAIAGGAAYCWGKNGNGQLGIGSTADATTAQAVTGLAAGVSSISAGSGSSACATRYGLAYCWGYDSNGQLGDASTTQRASPVQVSLTGGTAFLAGHAATAVAVGDSHACAVTDAGIGCWGAGSSGQMGNTSTTTTNSSPVVVSGSSAWSAKSITASGGHTCALASSGIMYCWGLGSSGELGNNSTTSTNSSPVPVTSTGALSGVTVHDLSAGAASTCASGQGRLYCWGGNGSYQLGDGTTTMRTVPVSATSPTVAGCADGASLLAGGSTCSLAPSTSYWWRLGYTLGPWSSPYSSWIQATTSARDASAPSATSTTATSTSISWSPFTPAGLQTGRYVLQRATDPGGSNLTTLADGAATSFTDITGSSSSGTPTATAVGTGTAGACSIAGDAVWCFGWNGDGQLGNGTTNDDSYAPTRVVGLDGMRITGLGSGATNDGTGDWARCAIANGAAWCWGYNVNGQLGNGTWGSGTNSSVPVPVSTSTGLAGKTVTAISSSEEHSCAVTGDGLLFCWGRNVYGQLGINSTTDYNTPQQVTALAGKTVTAVSAGSSRTCAIANGAAYCWGENGSGAVGNNTTTNQLTPVAVATTTMASTVTAISTGYNSSCAIAGGALYCWGGNGKGQVGNGSTTQVNAPTQVTTSGALSGVTPTFVNVGAQFACAVASGAAYCWGYNVSGQLGNGSTKDTVSAPVAVYASGALSGTTVTAISAGYRKTCAVASGGEYCWGAGAGGLGDGSGSTSDSSVPVAVSLPAGTICPTGACHVTATSCSLAAGTTYYYRVAYYIGSWTGPTSGWVAVTTSPN